MAALTITPVNPIVVEGSIKARTYTISGAVADADTIAITEFNTVLDAYLVPATAAGVGLAFSGAGNRTLTVKATAGFTAGRLTVRGF